MRFIFVSDLHSNRVLYDELEELIVNVAANALIIGGDIFDYSSDAEPQLAFAREFLYDFFKKINIEIYAIPGNCDRPKAVKYLNDMKKELGINLLGLVGTNVHNNIKLFGYANIPPSPFKIKDYERRDMAIDLICFETPCLLSNSNGELNLVNCDFLNNLPSIEEELNCLYIKKSIWVMHSPPYGGILDITHTGIYAGSKAIRRQIERVQPCITLHGHIHEAPAISNKWAERIGRTLSVNPGTVESLHAIIFDMDECGNIIYIKHNVYGELRLM